MAREATASDDVPVGRGRQELRLQEQRRLLAFIADHPGLHQREILEAAAKWGWARSTTQHRLGRLIDAGLVESERQGRGKRYGTPEG